MTKFCFPKRCLFVSGSLIVRVTLIAVMMSPSLFGQNPPTTAKSFRDRVVDKATLAEGAQLWGMVVEKKPAKVFMSTAWLKQNQSAFFEREVLPELQKNKADSFATLSGLLKADVERLQEATPVDRQRIGLLKEVIRTLVPNDDTVPQFVILEIPKARLRNLESQPDSRRDLCRFAILNGIPDIEETHWKSVSEQLQRIPAAARKISPESTQVDDDLSRQRILAAVDIRMNTVMRLIQNGKSIYDESAAPDLSAVVSTMLEGNVQSLLGELLNEGGARQQPVAQEDSLPDAARRMAEEKNHSTIVLSGFQFDLAGGSATVTHRLFHKSDDSQWKLLVSSAGTSTAADVKPGQVAAIENDPQVKEISSLVEGLGLGGGQFGNALQMGAVVQNAMRDAEAVFEEKIQSILTAKGLSQATETPVVVLQDKASQEAAP